MTLNDFYDNTYLELFNYFAMYSKNIDDCRTLLFSTYKAYILQYRKRRMFNSRSIDKLMSIAGGELNKYYDTVYDNKENITVGEEDVYIQEGHLNRKYYSINDANGVKSDVYDLLKDLMNEENRHNKYTVRKIIAFFSSLLYICIFSHTYIPKDNEHHETDYECYEMQLIDNRLYFSDGNLKYVDISEERGKSNVVSENRVERFYIFDDSIIYLNYNGIYVSNLNGSESRVLIDYNLHKPWKRPVQAKAAIFYPYQNGIYFSHVYLNKKSLVMDIYCYDIQNEVIKTIYTREFAYEPDNIFMFGLQIIGINENTIYFLKEDTAGVPAKPDSVVKDAIKAYSLDLKIEYELFKIPRSYFYETQIKLEDGSIYASPIHIKANANGKEYLSSQIIKYSLKGEIISKSKTNKIYAGTLRLTDEGELYFQYENTISKLNINTNVVSNVYKLDTIFRNSAVDTFFADGHFCFTARDDDIYTLFVIRPNGKVLKYNIVVEYIYIKG